MGDGRYELRLSASDSHVDYTPRLTRPFGASRKAGQAPTSWKWERLRRPAVPRFAHDQRSPGKPKVGRTTRRRA